MKLDNLEFQIKHTTGNMLTANQQSPYQHCPQVKSHLSGCSSLPGHSQLMAEPSNSGGVQAPENFSKYKGSKVTFWPRPASTWVNLVDPTCRLGGHLCSGEFNAFKFPCQDIIDLMCESRSDNNNAGEASLEVRVLFANNS